MTLSRRATFAAEPCSAPLVRKFIEAYLIHHGLETLIDDANLAINEVVANAIMATVRLGLRPAPPIQLYAKVLPDMVLVGVENHTDEVPVLKDASEEAENGRGLSIVDFLAKRYGWSVLDNPEHPTPTLLVFLAFEYLPRRHPVDWDAVTANFMISHLLGFRYASVPHAQLAVA